MQEVLLVRLRSPVRELRVPEAQVQAQVQILAEVALEALVPLEMGS